MQWVPVIGTLLIACGGSSRSTVDGAVEDAITLSTLEAYGKAWDANDSATRRRLLEYSAVDTLVVHEPTRTLGSREAVYDAMTQFHDDVPGGTVPIIGNARDTHRVWLRWNVLDSAGATIATGVDLMRRAPDDRLDRVHSFFGARPVAVGSSNVVQQALLDAWNEPDTVDRQMLLEAAVSDDVTFLVEGQTAMTGRAAMAAAMPGVYPETGRQMQLASGYLDLPQAWTAEWRVAASDDTTIAQGVMFALVGSDGRLDELVYFTGLVP